MEATKKKSVSVTVLDALASAGAEGMSFGQLQDVAYATSHRGAPRPKRLRGWWCCQLSGSALDHQGLLRAFATKGADGRWRRNEVAHQGRPWPIVRQGKHPNNFQWTGPHASA